MKNKMDNRRNQRGVALLFALGILSLLLIFGLAFVTNALLSQKIAGNNRSRSQAKMLAQSAISRMAISMMFYQYEAANAGFIPLNYMDVHSFYDLNGTPGKTPSALEATDGLRGGAGSILVSNMNLTNYDLAREDHQKAQWSYITAKDDSGENKIVGRIAYQVLPSNASAHINLDHALRGVYDSGDPLRKPWSVRIGADINELNLDATTVFNDWENSHAPSDPDNMTAATFDAFFSAYKDSLFAGTPAEKTEKETWVRRWFADGTVAADSEYYRDDSGSKPKFYHRFNLGKIDPEAVKPDTIVDQWYDRLDISGADKNSQNAVEKLAGNSEVFKITDKWTPGGIGLPFLKFIANDKGTFADLENRRRQIAANLNDYCDEDSIPTSNVDAKTWGDILDSSTPDTSWPKYTGNEKTPYINEFAFGFKVTPALVAGKSSGGIDTSKAAISLKLDRVELIAELVKIYENLQNLKDYKLATYLQEFSIGFKATAKIKITYTEGDPPETKTLEQDVPVMTSGSFLCDPQKVEISFKSSASNWKNGYIVDAVELVLKDMSST
ncbi:MAG: hypothetical protein LBM70_05380, partial [Victivallales bacterium]|nr:hypothetical protein [Victivallales bacterium]